MILEGEKMEEDFKYLYDLIDEKKKNILTELDQEKINQIEDLLKIKGIFFKLNLDTVVGILDFLGVPRDSIKELYGRLTSPEAFIKISTKEYDVVEIPQK